MENKFIKYRNKDWNFKATNDWPVFMCKKNFPVPFFSLISLFVEDANYNISDCYVADNRLFIMCRYKGKSNELMMRFGSNNLVVARVEFIHKRKGNMTKLYHILKKIQRKFHTGPIYIECVQTDSMRAWCEKNNFVSVDGLNYHEQM